MTIRYGERLHSDGRIDQEHISKHVVAPDNFQTDRYILRGDGVESWEPRFTYHGFRYIEITTEAGVIVEKVEGRLVHTAFGQAGEFLCSDTTINRLQECTRWSYINNFTGIPTDCPQREKNGWTGDAHLAAETGLYNYTAASSYAQWMESLCDAQRPSGQVPAIIPTGGWGFNRFSGPAWDSALFLIPWYIYLHTGDQHPILAHYDAMRRYIDYCAQRADGNIISFGLGDWNHFDPERIIDTSLTSTAFYHTNVQLLSRFAQIAGREDDQIYYRQMAHSIRKAFTKTFYRGNGIYLDGQQTGLGAALVNDLVPDGQHNAVTQALAQTVEANGYRPDFGILGAKWVPRALAENGHALTAYRLITQPDFPGWVNWLRQGATTLWESWWGRSSLNHIMFGNISAWFYRYLAGIRPDPQVPGFKHIIIKPETIAPLNWVQASHTCAHGVIESHWQRSGQRITLSVSIPAECRATVYLPCGKRETVGAGKHSFQSASLTAEPSRNNTGHITEETACHTPPVQEMAEAPYRNRI